MTELVNLCLDYKTELVIEFTYIEYKSAQNSGVTKPLNASWL